MGTNEPKDLPFWPTIITAIAITMVATYIVFDVAPTRHEPLFKLDHKTLPNECVK